VAWSRRRSQARVAAGAIVAACALVLVAAAVTPAQTQPDAWQVTSAALGEAPQMAVDGAGTGVIAGLVDSGLAVRSRPPGGQVGSPGRISTGRDRVLAFGLGAGRNGRALLAWRQGASARTARLRFAVGGTGGRFGAPRALAGTGPLAAVRKAPAGAADTPVVAVADDGAALIAWLVVGRRGCGRAVRAVLVRADGGAGPPRTISRGCADAARLTAALGGPDQGAIVWREGRACPVGRRCALRVVAALVRGGRVERARAVSRSPVDATGPTVAAGEQRTLVTWRDAARVDRTGSYGRVLVSGRARSARFGAPQPVSIATALVGRPAASIGAGGDAIVVWAVRRSQVEAAFSRSGAPFGAPERIAGAGSDARDSDPYVALDPRGEALIMYRTPSYGVGLNVRLRDGQIGEGLYAAGSTRWVGASERELLALWDDRMYRLAALPTGRAQPAGAVDIAPAG
jgi:hypothetical protein